MVKNKRFEIIKNPDPKAKSNLKYVAILNPVGDKKYGFLDWDKKKFFPSREKAMCWVKRNLK